MARSKTTEPTWLDILPAIRLARGVPVRHYLDHAHKALVIECGRFRFATTAGYEIKALGGPVDWRVDLDDPQGFAYVAHHIGSLGAILVLRRHLGLAHRMSTGDVGHHLLALLTGQEEVTEADKIAIARAAAELHQ